MYAPKANRINGQEGFMLMDLLVAVVIIGILAAIAIPPYKDYIKRANDAATLVDLQKTAEAWEICRDKNCDFVLETEGSSATIDRVAACRNCLNQMDDGIKYVMSSEFSVIEYGNIDYNYNIKAWSRKGLSTFCWYNPPGDLDTIPGLGAMCPNMW